MDRIRRIGKWLWDSLGNIAVLGAWMVSFALPAWAAKAAGFMLQYQPFSWVAVGFAGMLTTALIYAVVGWGRNLWVTASIRNRFYRQTDRFNPMDTIFQRQRIAIADLANPMEQIIRNKKFIDCEMIGPANILMLLSAPGTGKLIGNTFNKFDAVVISNDAAPQSAMAFVDCDFERCSFYNVVLLIQERNADEANGAIDTMHWITPGAPQVQRPVPLIAAPIKERKGFWPWMKK
jgi:hypothetical protein